MEVQPVMKETLVNLWLQHRPVVLEIGRRLLTAALIVAAGRGVTLIAGKFLRRLRTGRLKLDETLAQVLQSVATYGILIICLIMILDNFGFNTTSLIALLGAAGVAVGLALKDTLSNIAAGILLLLLRPFQKGHFIEFGAISGSVRDMNLFATILETGDGVYISAPNAALWGLPLKNYSRNPRRRMDLSAVIPLSASIDDAFAVLQDIADSEPRFLTDPPPQIMLQPAPDSLTVTLRAWAGSAVYWDLYWEHTRALQEKMRAAGLAPPFPRRDIRIVREQIAESK
jgi:small conductance mechanosensitive channel